MRIIAGQFRGRRLLPPADADTRPITDRVKQSLFDILTPQLEGARVYDCFAGTGSMGLESISRGASHVTFFEAGRSAGALLRQNIQALQVGRQCTIVQQDLFRWFEAVPTTDERVDVIFLDPPYRFLRERAADLQLLAERMREHHLKADSTVIFRHDAGDSLVLPALKAYDVRSYGSMTLELLHPHPPLV